MLLSSFLVTIVVVVITVLIAVVDVGIVAIVVVVVVVVVIVIIFVVACTFKFNSLFYAILHCFAINTIILYYTFGSSFSLSHSTLKK